MNLHIDNCVEYYRNDTNNIVSYNYNQYDFIETQCMIK